MGVFIAVTFTSTGCSEEVDTVVGVTTTVHEGWEGGGVVEGAVVEGAVVEGAVVCAGRSGLAAAAAPPPLLWLLFPG